MGEAKRRGTQEQRKAAAIEREAKRREEEKERQRLRWLQQEQILREIEDMLNQGKSRTQPFS